MKTTLTTIACLAALTTLSQANKPNIVLIMADDVGLGDIGRQHKERTGQDALAPTPAIDALADSGMWFTDAHSPTALCSPTRYAVMTGNYNYRSYAPWGVWGSFRKTAIEASDATLGTVTQAGGYHTGFVGKWHLGGDFYKTGTEEIYRGNDRGESKIGVDMTRWIANGPQDLGFDYDYTLPTGVQGPVYVAFENGLWAPLGENSELIHLTDQTAKDPVFVSDKGHGIGDSEWDARNLNIVLAEKAANFIERSAKQEAPFFLCYWSPAVHKPHTPPEALDGVPIKGTTPSQHTDMNRVLDWEVEQIINALKANGSYEDTIIIFTSDNGGLWDRVAQKTTHRSNGGFRSNKNAPHEGGQRVPFIVSWPGVVEPGSRNHGLVNGTDLIATIATIAGAQLANDQAMDSFNLLPVFKGEAPSPRQEIMLQAGSKNEIMYRSGDWKLIVQSNHHLTKWDPIALFNLKENPKEKESENLINNPEFSQRVKDMLKTYLEIRHNGARTAPPIG